MAYYAKNKDTGEVLQLNEATGDFEPITAFHEESGERFTLKESGWEMIEPKAGEVYGRGWNNLKMGLRKAAGGFAQYLGENQPEQNFIRNLERYKNADRPGDKIFATIDAMASAPLAGLNMIDNIMRGEKSKRRIAAARQRLAEVGEDIFDAADAQYQNIPAGPGVKSPNWYVAQAMSAGGQTVLPALGVGIATRNPLAAGATMYPIVQGQTYGQERAAGEDPYTASTRAHFDALTEVATELPVFNTLFKGGGGIFKRMLKGAGTEAFGESVNQILQDAYANGIIEEKMTWGQMASNMVDAGIIGAIMGFAMGGMTPGRPDQAAVDEQIAMEPGTIEPGKGMTPVGGVTRNDYGESDMYVDANGNVMPGAARKAFYQFADELERQPGTAAEKAKRAEQAMEMRSRLDGFVRQPAPREYGQDTQLGAQEDIAVTPEGQGFYGAVPPTDAEAGRDRQRRELEGAREALYDLQRQRLQMDSQPASKATQRKYRALTKKIEQQQALVDELEGKEAPQAAPEPAPAQLPAPGDVAYRVPPGGFQAPPAVDTTPDAIADLQAQILQEEQKRPKSRGARANQGKRIKALRAKIAELQNKPKPKTTADVAQEVYGERARVKGEKARAERLAQLPPNFQDQRLSRPLYRERIKGMLGDLQKDGGITYIKDENDRILERTPSLNPEWFKDKGWTKKMAEKAVDKALKGEKLGTRQATIVETMLDEVTEDRKDAADTMRRQLAEAREAFKRSAEAIGLTDAWVEDMKQQAGMYFEESQYDPNWPASSRLLFEIAMEARHYDRARVKQIIQNAKEREGGEMGAAMDLLEVIANGQAAEARAAAEGGRQEGPEAADTSGGEFALETHTEADLAEREAAINAAAEEAATEVPSPESFELTGSPLPADQGTAQGQTDLVEEARKPQAARGLGRLPDAALGAALDYMGMDPYQVPLNIFSQEEQQILRDAGVVEALESEPDPETGETREFEGVRQDVLNAERDRRSAAKKAAKKEEARKPAPEAKAVARNQVVMGDVDVELEAGVPIVVDQTAKFSDMPSEKRSQFPVFHATVATEVEGDTVQARDGEKFVYYDKSDVRPRPQKMIREGGDVQAAAKAEGDMAQQFYIRQVYQLREEEKNRAGSVQHAWGMGWPSNQKSRDDYNTVYQLVDWFDLPYMLQHAIASQWGEREEGAMAEEARTWLDAHVEPEGDLDTVVHNYLRKMEQRRYRGLSRGQQVSWKPPKNAKLGSERRTAYVTELRGSAAKGIKATIVLADTWQTTTAAWSQMSPGYQMPKRGEEVDAMIRQGRNTDTEAHWSKAEGGERARMIRQIGGEATDEKYQRVIWSALPVYQRDAMLRFNGEVSVPEAFEDRPPEQPEVSTRPKPPPSRTRDKAAKLRAKFQKDGNLTKSEARWLRDYFHKYLVREAPSHAMKQMFKYHELDMDVIDRVPVEGSGLEVLVRKYASGMTAKGDLKAAIEGERSAGIDIMLMSDARIQDLVNQLRRLKAKGPTNFKLFVDNHAFSAFRQGKEAPHREVMRRFLLLAQDDIADMLTMVAPDVVGDQLATLNLLAAYAEPLRYLQDGGVDLIVPYQRGEMSPEMFHLGVLMNLEPRQTYRIGIPSEEQAMSPAELKELVKFIPSWDSWHILGSVSGAYFTRRMQPLVLYGEAGDSKDISADANRLRAKATRGNRGGARRAVVAEKDLEVIDSQPGLFLDLDQETEYQQHKDTSFGLTQAQVDALDKETANARIRAVREWKKIVRWGKKRGSTILGAYKASMEVFGFIPLKGQQVHSAADLAVEAQVYRNPHFETFRWIITNGEGVVVHQEGLSSRLPGSVAVLKPGQTPDDLVTEIYNRLEQAGAGATIYLMHNHPSGHSRPSRGDMLVTAFLMQKMYEQGIEVRPGRTGRYNFGGHVIIDHNEFSVISQNADSRYHNEAFGRKVERTRQEASNSAYAQVTLPWDVETRELPAGTEMLHKHLKEGRTAQPHPLLGMNMAGDEMMAVAAKAAQENQDSITLIGTGVNEAGYAMVGAVGEASWLETVNSMGDNIVEFQMFTRTHEVHVYNVPPHQAQEFISLINLGIIADATLKGDVWSLTSTGRAQYRSLRVSAADRGGSLPVDYASSLDMPRIPRAKRNRVLQREIDTLTPAEKKVFDRELRRRGDGPAVRKRLKKLKGTPWARQAIEGVFVRAGMERLLDGKEPEVFSALDKGNTPGMRQALKNGEDAAWHYLLSNGIMGHAEKPVNNVNGSFIDCDPSPDCAKYCYATRGRYTYDNVVAKAELVTLLVGRDPKRAAAQTVNEYKLTAEYANGKALRLYDKGDLSEVWLPYIEEVNRLGVRLQIFSKQPELLRQVSDFNLRLLSADKSNIEVAKANPDLPVALVYEGREMIPDVQALLDSGQIQVVLPIMQGQKKLDREEYTALKRGAPGIGPYICPIDAGIKKLRTRKTKGVKGAWNCTDCDKQGALGCFYGSPTTAAIGAESQRVNDYDIRQQAAELQERIRDYYSEAGVLLGADGRRDAGRLDRIFANLGSLLDEIQSEVDGEGEGRFHRATRPGNSSKAGGPGGFAGESRLGPERAAARRERGGDDNAEPDGDGFPFDLDQPRPLREKQRSSDPVDKAEVQTYTQRIHDFLDRADAWLDVFGQLPDRDAYKKERYLALGKIGEADIMARNMRDAFLKASPETKVEVYNFLTTQGANPAMITNPAARRNAVKAKDSIIKVGQMLVDRGLLPDEVYQAVKGGYLPRLYLRYLLEDSDIQAMAGGKTPSDMGYLKERKDIPEDVRRVLLGEIMDPGFLAAAAIARPMRDMALLDWFGFISENEKWVPAASILEVEGLPGRGPTKGTPYFFKAEAERLRKQARHYPNQADAQQAREIAERYEAAAEAAIKGLKQYGLEGYSQLPNNPRYGRLRGMWVHKTIYDDIVGIRSAAVKDAGAAEKIFGYGSWGTKLQQFFKFAKVPANPPAQVRNFVSNLVLLQLSGVPMYRIPEYMARAISEIRGNGKHWKIAKKYGVTEATFTAQELVDFRSEVLELLNAENNLSGYQKVERFLRNGLSTVGNTYQLVEALGKTMKITDAMERQKLSEGDAALEAQKWLFDYSLVPRDVRYLRNAPIGAPFLTFYYKVAPRLAEVALLHPWRFTPWVALFLGLPFLMASLNDVDEEDIRALRKSLPEWLRSRGHAVMLPMKDSYGRWQFLDLGYFMPWSMFTDIGGALARGEPGAAFESTGILNGPLSAAISVINTGVDPFTDRPVWNEADPPAKQWMDIMHYVYNTMAPPWLTFAGTGGFGFIGKMIDAYTGSTNYYGEVQVTKPQAWGRLLGANVYSVDPDLSRSNNIRMMVRDIEDVRRRYQYKMRMERNPAKQDKIRDTYEAEIQRRQKKLQRYREESIVPRELLTAPQPYTE